MDLWLVTAALASACTVSVQHSRTSQSQLKTEIEALGLLLYGGPLTRIIPRQQWHWYTLLESPRNLPSRRTLAGC